MLPDMLSNLGSMLSIKPSADAQISGFAIDSRQVQPGDLFFALKGARDGHDFLQSAKERGAAAAVVARPASMMPTLQVEDPEQALTALARGFRDAFENPVIALTGSQGKTSTRGFIAAILARTAARAGQDILVTRGNFNNQLGVPLTASRLRANHAYAVFELGASKVGDIDHIAGIVRPKVSALLNARAAHLEGFGSREGVVQGKGEIIDHTACDGVVVLNADEAAFPIWQKRAGDRVVQTFGQVSADVLWQPLTDQRMRLIFEGTEVDVELPTLGVHFMENAAAAVAVSRAAGAWVEDMVDGLQSAVIEPGRMTPYQCGSMRLIDDTYNASPEAVRAAIDWLARQSGARLLILGHLAELGEAADSEMHALGRYARTQGIDQLIAVGQAKPIAEGFGAMAHYVENIEALQFEIKKRVAGVDVALVKGSRAAQMDRVVAYLQTLQGESV